MLHPYGYSVLILAVQLFTGDNELATLLGITAVQVLLDVAGIVLIFAAAKNPHGYRPESLLRPFMQSIP